MNQWSPEWDMRPPTEIEPRPDDYRPETPGPYTSPPTPDPPKRPRLGALVIAGVLGALFIVGLAVSASRDDTVVELPNTVINPTPRTAYDMPSQQSDPTLSGLAPLPTRFTPQAHKPGPAAR